jgi:hypothetical protein
MNSLFFFVGWWLGSAELIASHKPLDWEIIIDGMS